MRLVNPIESFSIVLPGSARCLKYIPDVLIFYKDYINRLCQTSLLAAAVNGRSVQFWI